MLLSKDAIADVVRYCARRTSIVRLTSLSTTPSSISMAAVSRRTRSTVTNELTRIGQLARVKRSGLPAHPACRLCPTAANAGYYAQIVAERAVLRRLVTAGTRIVQMGYDTASGAGGIVGGVDDVVDRAQAEIYDVTERRTSEDYVHIESLLQGRWTRSIASRPRVELGPGFRLGSAAWTRSPTVSTPDR